MPGKQTHSPTSLRTQMYGHACTHAKSKRAVGQSVRIQLGPVGADLVDKAPARRAGLGGKRGAASRGMGGHGGTGQTQIQFRRWDMSGRAGSHSPMTPPPPCSPPLW